MSYFEEKTKPKRSKKGQCRFGFATVESGGKFYVPVNEGQYADHPLATSIGNMRTHVWRQNRLTEKTFKCRLWADNNEFIEVERLS